LDSHATLENFPQPVYHLWWMLILPVHRELWITLLVSVFARAQGAGDAAELLRKVQSAADNTKTWRGEVVVTSQISGGGMNLHNEVLVKISVQAPLKMSRQNSGGDQTILVCDGAEAFYSGDRNSYYRHDAKVNPDRNYPLSKLYKLDNDPATAVFVGRDQVRLAEGPRACVVVRAVWKHATADTIRTMCIDSDSALILRDVVESEDEKTGVRMVNTTVFTSYESDPTFPPDTFRFSIPPGAVEAKSPI
jgi:outer membrane lipoprotein-sorting protein